MDPVVESLLYELVVVEEPTVEVEMCSARGTVTWRRSVEVGRLVHHEVIPSVLSSEADRLAYRERLTRFAQGTATEQFFALLTKTALHTGLDWLVLNLEVGSYVFLFSTRQQERLAEALGSEAGIIEGGSSTFFVLTDRRVSQEVCFCVRTRSYRICVRYFFEPAYVSILMSDFFRVGAGRGPLRLGAEEAIHYLRALRWGMRPSGGGFIKLPPVVGRLPLELSGGTWPMGRPAFPADLRRVIRSVEVSSSEGDDVSFSSSERCPLCGGALFHLSERDVFCRSCDWSNLPPLPESQESSS